MTSIAEFLNELTPGRHEPLLEKVGASIRYDIVDSDRAEHRLVVIDHGELRVSAPATLSADCVLRGDRAVFDDLVNGRVNVMSALLRGLLTVEGDPELLVLMQRMLPGRNAS